ncbi:ArsR/SmtB family transcription factor [Actinoplanes sp. NPDC049599]|uniref:ArsR/SmtB family transcription factor n=1 Tax=Actinoplanes sp. NPDC049599 TaxID=3363903 RepID=UPI0037B977B2
MADDALDRIFAALADPTRREILRRVVAGDTTLTDLTASFAISTQALWRHLRVLERAGLISRYRNAQRRPCRLESVILDDTAEWLLALSASGRTRWG